MLLGIWTYLKKDTCISSTVTEMVHVYIVQHYVYLDNFSLPLLQPLYLPLDYASWLKAQLQVVYTPHTCPTQRNTQVSEALSIATHEPA